MKMITEEDHWGHFSSLSPVPKDSVKEAALTEADLFPSNINKASQRLHLRTLVDLIKPEKLCTACITGVFMSNLHPQDKGTFQWGGKYDPAVQVFTGCDYCILTEENMAWKLCQRKLTCLSVMTFRMILTFRLSWVYQHRSIADINLLLLLPLTDCLQAVRSLRCACCL